MRRPDWRYSDISRVAVRVRHPLRNSSGSGRSAYFPRTLGLPHAIAQLLDVGCGVPGGRASGVLGGRRDAGSAVPVRVPPSARQLLGAAVAHLVKQISGPLLADVQRLPMPAPASDHAAA